MEWPGTASRFRCNSSSSGQVMTDTTECISKQQFRQQYEFAKLQKQRQTRHYKVVSADVGYSIRGGLWSYNTARDPWRVSYGHVFLRLNVLLSENGVADPAE